MLTVRNIQNREDFQSLIIAQGDRYDDDTACYDNGGYVVVFDGKEAAIARFGHCSCYGTFTAVAGGDYGSSGSVPLIFDWYGTLDELLKMARYKLDPHFTLGSRKADPADYDHCYLMFAYGKVLEWNRNRKKG